MYPENQSDMIEKLGGKSPVIIAPCANLKVMARRFLSMKVKGGGQACGESTSMVIDITSDA